MRNVIFGERIKEQRNQLQLTQADVAKKLFTTRQTISNWEKGKSYPDLSTLIKISDFYHVSIDSLLREDQELKKSLERDTVQKKFDILSSLLSIFGLLVVLLIMLIADTTAFNKPMVAPLTIAILILNGLITLVASRFSTYISDNRLLKKLIPKIVTIFLICTLIIFTALYFYTGKQLDKAINYLEYTLFIVTAILCIIATTISTVIAYINKKKARE